MIAVFPLDDACIQIIISNIRNQECFISDHVQENEFQKNITKWLKLLERVLGMRINFGRWEVPDAEVRMVEGTHERTAGRVVIGAGVSDEFGIHIGLRQVSALSPMLFIVVLD